MEEIIENDPKFTNIREPGDFLFVDRGFRDIRRKLENEYGLNVIIPFIQQHSEEHDEDLSKPKKINKNAPLSCLESGRARVCTKVRSMVERFFSRVKQHYSLDYVRNTMIGHLGIDLKIFCAMYNYTFVPESYDNPNTDYVAENLKKRLNRYKENPLQFLLGSRRPILTNEKKFTRIDINTVRDFIRLKRSYMKKKIFFGSFHYKQALNYTIDLLKRSKAYSFKITKTIKSMPNFDADSEIIVVRMPSRMKRGKDKKKILAKNKNSPEELEEFRNTNTVFLHYRSLYAGKLDKNSKQTKCDQIRSWICSCKNGKRMAGVCSHVATLIHWLAR